MADPFYQFKRVAAAGEDLDKHLADLGREGWNIAAAMDGWLYLQRLVAEESAQPEVVEAGEAAGPAEEMVEALCGCGCGDELSVTLRDYRVAREAKMVWYIAGHGPGATEHDGDYVAPPRRRSPVT